VVPLIASRHCLIASCTRTPRDPDWPANPFEVVKVPEGLQRNPSNRLRSAGFLVYFSPRISGLAALEGQRRLFVIVTGDEIVVTSDTGFRAAYCRRPHHPKLIVRRRTDTDDHEMIAQAWQAANDKARELGWIV
jgi:hypothetical protein